MAAVIKVEWESVERRNYQDREFFTEVGKTERVKKKNLKFVSEEVIRHFLR